MTGWVAAAGPAAAQQIWASVLPGEANLGAAPELVGDLGLAFVTDMSDELSGNDLTVSHTPAIALSGGASWHLTDLVRVGASLGYTRSWGDEVTEVPGATSNTASADGGMSVLHGMARLRYDALPGETFTPRVGLGAGLARISSDISADGLDNSSNFQIDDAVWTPAWEVRTGVAYRPDSGLVITGGYRLLAGWPRRLDTTYDGSDESFYAGLRAHALTLGLRYPF